MMDLQIYDYFVECYNNPSLTATDVMRHCQLNSHRYAEIKSIAVENGDISPVRRMNRTDAKFYTKTSNGYVVKKQFGKDCLFVGRFPNETTAKAVVNECKKVNWELDTIEDFIDAHKIKPRNYSLINNRYHVQKVVDGRNVCFCTVESEDVAKRVVVELRKVDWDYSQVESILNKIKMDGVFL